MKKYFLLILVFLTVLKNHAQKKHTVTVSNQQTDKAIIIKAKNNNETQYQITLTVNQKGLKGYTKPIVKLIPANSEIEVVKLYYIRGKRWSYNSTYKYVEKPTNKEIADRKQKLKDKLLDDTGNITKGIVVFSKDGCPRCNFTTKYLLDNDIDFKYLNTSENKNYNRLMWSLLRQKYPDAVIKSVTMPVVLVDGELSYNMKDLKGFVNKLKN